MIPYFGATVFHLGPIPIQVWGTFVAIGVLAGTALAAWLAKKRGENPAVMWDLAFWTILGAFIGARLFHVLFYEPAYYFANPSEMIAIWKGGLSVSGGLIGAAIAGIGFLRRKHLDLLAYADTALFGFPLGYAIGRLGCFLTHMHPGRPTDFFLGVRFPDGIVRHELGLYESLSGWLLLLLFLLIWKTRRTNIGSFLIIFLLWYGTDRFLLDFLRTTEEPMADVRYLGFTPAQYVAIVMIGFGLYLFRRVILSRRRRIS